MLDTGALGVGGLAQTTEPQCLPYSYLFLSFDIFPPQNASGTATGDW